MTQEEQIRLYRLMEKLNWFFTKRCTTWIGRRQKRPHGSAIRRFGILHTIFLWNDLPKEVQEKLMDEEESL